MAAFIETQFPIACLSGESYKERKANNGQIPDTLEDLGVHIALKDEAAARQLIDRTTATRNPFDVKYSNVQDADWETCSTVLNKTSFRDLMSSGWKQKQTGSW